MTATRKPLEEARRRWGTGEVLGSTRRPAPTFGVAARFTVNVEQRVSRVVEQRRDVSSYRLDKGETP